MAIKNTVLISIRPKWCEKIINGEKTVEIRKTKPKTETPFKCYIYCTKAKELFFHGGIGETLDDLYRMPTGEIRFGYSGELMLCNEPYSSDNFLNGKIIGEFICDEITYLGNISTDRWERLLGSTHEQHKKLVTENACLTEEELLGYGGKYAWHISNLVIYDKPRELGEFIVPSKIGCANEGKCRGCIYHDRGNGYNVEDDCYADFSTDDYKPLRKAPQSWCYAEEANHG